ncbi:glycosyltransferase family 17 protein [Rhodotorula sp. JG-1b]|nr:glycosyltransferase family 17 protein [Rhodotorula sp. JG-1b]
MPRVRTVATALGGLCCAWFLFVHPFLPRGYFAYSTRPLWDRDEAPQQVLRQYWTPDLAPADRCRLHGWTARDEETQVWDATIFSTETDLYLTRLHELAPVVDRFFVLESDRTFTGLEKPLVLHDLLEKDPRFAPFRAKITYRTFNGRTLEEGESPFAQEGQMRTAMTDLLRPELANAKGPPPVMLFSDVDEIPSRRTAQLLKACDFEAPMHLGLRSYLYSFEFEEGGETASWRAKAVQWPERGNGADEFYSWCFRRLSEFKTKAEGYSHVDRLGSRPSALLRPERIQKTICTGLDFFGMLPEAYTYRDLIDKVRIRPKQSAVDIPSYVVEHPDELRYLLPGPGHCIREDAPPGS